jgi:lipoate-protein ligase A
MGPPVNTLDVVRRLTGGGAILHDLELTYSLTVPAGHGLLSGGPNRLYELAHDAVIAALATLRVQASRGGPTDGSGAARGPFFCFARRHGFDVLADGAKLAGSAQRRTRAAVLQHGSIILGNRFPQQPTAEVRLPFEESAKRLGTLLADEFARLSGLALVPGDWTQRESALASDLMPKYAGSSWTRRT